MYHSRKEGTTQRLNEGKAVNHKNAMPEGLSVVNHYFPINHAYIYLDLGRFFMYFDIELL